MVLAAGQEGLVRQRETGGFQSPCLRLRALQRALRFDSHMPTVPVRAAQDGACASRMPCCKLAHNLPWVMLNPKTAAQAFIGSGKEGMFFTIAFTELILVQLNVGQFRAVPW